MDTARARRWQRAGWALALMIVGSSAVTHAQSVGSATNHGCDYAAPASWPLDDQLARAEACLFPSALVPVETRGRMSFASGIRHYATPQTRDALYAASANATFEVNSAFRTLLEQYWLYTARSPACGSVLAPGSSNHESGSAVDIQQYTTARSALQAAGCTWAAIGSDPWHYNCLPSGAARHTVQTFQHLWNLNNPSDHISEDNVWGPQTKARLAASPRAGFAIDGCTAAPPPPQDAGVPPSDASVGYGDASVASDDASFAHDAGVPADGSRAGADAASTHGGVVMSSGCNASPGGHSPPSTLALLGGIALVVRRRRSAKR